METTVVYWGYIGIMEKKMKTTVVYWGYIGIMNGKENGNYYVSLPSVVVTEQLATVIIVSCLILVGFRVMTLKPNYLLRACGKTL